jgi:hypothetical protein
MGAAMNDWKSELDALVAETMAFTKSLKVVIDAPRSLPEQALKRGGLSAPDDGGSEREEIKKRVERFKAHQVRFTREREEYANSLLRRIKPITNA